MAGQAVTFIVGLTSTYGSYTLTGQSVTLVGPPIPIILHALPDDWALVASAFPVTLSALPDDWNLNSE